MVLRRGNKLPGGYTIVDCCMICVHFEQGRFNTYCTEETGEPRLDFKKISEIRKWEQQHVTVGAGWCPSFKRLDLEMHRLSPDGRYWGDVC
jgi:hypothetical protein